MIAYIPIPNNMTPDQRVVDSLLLQVDRVELIECGELRDRKDKMRYIDIGKGRVEAMNRAVASGEEFFCINNSGALHKNEYGIARCVIFLKKNPTWGCVSLTPNKANGTGNLLEKFTRLESAVFRMEAVKDISISWTIPEEECAKIKRALKKRKWEMTYLEREPKHLKDIGIGFAKKVEDG